MISYNVRDIHFIIYADESIGIEIGDSYAGFTLDELEDVRNLAVFYLKEMNKKNGDSI